MRAVAKEFAGTGKRDRNDRDAHSDGCFEGAELKMTDAILTCKSALGEDKHRFAVAKNLFHLFGLAQAGSRVGAIEREMAHLAQKRADEGHTANFHFGHEAIRHAEPDHDRKHVEIAGVVGGVHFRAGSIHVLLADYANAAARKSK